jgi:hypothetical protein
LVGRLLAFQRNRVLSSLRLEQCKKNSQQKLNAGDIQVRCDPLVAGRKIDDILGEVQERPECTDVATEGAQLDVQSVNQLLTNH